jgi:hypothetical protein
VRVSSKRQWYEIQATGLFNTTFNSSVEEYRRRALDWPLDKIFCIRTMGAGGGLFTCRPNWEMTKLIETPAIKPLWSQIRISEQAPDDAIIVQGEYNGTVARISFEKTPMRFAFQQSSHEISRLQLLGILGYWRYKYLEDLLDAFDAGAVLEFSLYSKPVGIHHERMIIWEIRHY